MNSSGADLATIKPNDEQWIRNRMKDAGVESAGVWIGLNDLDNEGTWVWQDGTTPTYRNWLYTPGKVTDNDCATLFISSSSEGWMNTACDQNAKYVCSMEPVVESCDTNEVLDFM